MILGLARLSPPLASYSARNLRRIALVKKVWKAQSLTQSILKAQFRRMSVVDSQE